MRTPVDLFFDLLLFVLFAWVIVSPLIFIYWHFAPGKRGRLQSRHGNIPAVINIGTFLSRVFVLSIGIRSLLSFLPASWGWYEEGEFVQARKRVSASWHFTRLQIKHTGSRSLGGSITLPSRVDSRGLRDEQRAAVRP
jgi:hypothetical protein